MTYKLYKDDIVRHHLLELILWPNEDGTFSRIRHTAKELDDMGIYKDFKLTITITNSEHTSMHNKWHSSFKDSTVQSNNGKKGAVSRRRKIANGELSFKGENNPMYGKDAWAIACSRKTPEQIEATRKSKSEKMKKWHEQRRKEKEEHGHGFRS